MRKKQKPVHFRRKREGKTDYRKRLRLLLGKTPRAVFRRSIDFVWLQLINYNEKGDQVIITAHAKELKEKGWNGSFNNIPAAYLTGLLFAKKAKEAKVTKVIADNGPYATIPKSAFYAAIKGIRDGGLELPASEDVLPPEERIKGEHIKAYAEKMEKEKLSKQFSSEKQDPLKTPEIFEQVKQKLT